jgi:hypothetical protein
VTRLLWIAVDRQSFSAYQEAQHRASLPRSFHRLNYKQRTPERIA